MIDRAVYTVKEVAEILNTTSQTVMRAIHSGDIPSIKIGKRRKVPKTQLRQWLAGKNIQETTEGPSGPLADGGQ
jgi:excisionase family DNA binding protein